jgi:hypothetical protein
MAAIALGSGHIATAQSARPDRPPPPDTIRERISVRPNRPDSRHATPPRHSRRGALPDVTPALAATAYHDALARDIIDRARLARFHQDSTLTSYDATVKQRLSAGLNVKSIGRDRLIFRSELAARVRWNQSNRVWVDMLGARTAVPASFGGVKVLKGITDIVPIPYFSGSERLMWWFNFDGGVNSDDDEDMFSYVHPLDRGAEAVYEYRSGDSARIQLPGGQEISLGEVIVRAREASPDLIVGSLWFESGGQLVRAAFKPAAPTDMMKVVGEDAFEGVPAPIRATLLTPYTFDVEAFTIDYGLYGEHWWLPRSQTARGEMRVGPLRSTATIDQTFRYASVNGTDSIPTPTANMRRFGGNFGDDIGLIVQGTVDGVVPGNQFRRRSTSVECEKGDTLIHRERRNDLRIMIEMPCDTAALAHSPELPPSIFDKGEEAFGLAEARALAKELGVDKELEAVSGTSSSMRKGTVSYGWRRGLMRYNRVEGLSLGVLGERKLREVYDGSALLRFGSADLEPNVELRVGRGTSERSITLAGYHRLESANDWGDPFGLGGSLSALLFGRDEGYYFRSSGAELTGARAAGAATGMTWRLFAERQHNAPVETQWSLPNAFRGGEFEPNVRAVPATEGGATARLRTSYGLDPRGFRVSTDLRVEAAAGTFDYTRGALDVTASRYLFRNFGLSLTGGAGTSGGTLSPQRVWHVGGTSTVRGFRPDALTGESYWLARAELAFAGGSVLRPVAFYDAGWAGPRAEWSKSKGNIRGAGVGLSFLDGLARVDLARGVDPRTVWRAHLYVEAAF